jgi:GNAT superfamily N-acetyltransferase
LIAYEWRDRFDNTEVNGLHAEGFEHEAQAEDWWARVNHHSLGWVCAREDSELVGFVNVAWDGATHCFLLDTTVAPSRQRQGIGAALVAHAVALSKARGGDWLHVDYEDHLTSFYEGCGFVPTPAGLIQLYDD